MTIHMYHDPLAKKNVKDVLYAFLYSPVQSKLKNTLNSIIMRNTNTLASSHSSFVYRKEMYMLDFKEKPPRIMNRLVPELHGEMNEYLAEINELNAHEIPYVMGFVNQVLNTSNSLEDYMRIFPESLHRTLRGASDHLLNNEPMLSEDVVRDIQQRNQHNIELMKTRMVRNLILS